MNGLFLFAGSQTVPWKQPLGILAYVVVLPFFFWRYRRLPHQKQRLLLRSLAVLSLFIVFQSFVFSQTFQIVTSPYYYGALFSLFLAFPLALLLSPVPERVPDNFSRIVMLALLVVLAFNFIKINNEYFKREYEDFNLRQYYGSYFRREVRSADEGEDEKREEYAFATVLKA